MKVLFILVLLTSLAVSAKAQCFINGIIENDEICDDGKLSYKGTQLVDKNAKISYFGSSLSSRFSFDVNQNGTSAVLLSAGSVAYLYEKTGTDKWENILIYTLTGFGSLDTVHYAKEGHAIAFATTTQMVVFYRDSSREGFTRSPVTISVPNTCNTINRNASIVVFGTGSPTFGISVRRIGSVSISLLDPIFLPIQKGHNGNINGVSISEDDIVIVSGSSDETVKIWTITSPITYYVHRLIGETLQRSHLGSVLAVDTCGNGTWVVSATVSVIKVWKILSKNDTYISYDVQGLFYTFAGLNLTLLGTSNVMFGPSCDTIFAMVIGNLNRVITWNLYQDIWIPEEIVEPDLQTHTASMNSVRTPKIKDVVFSMSIIPENILKEWRKKDGKWTSTILSMDVSSKSDTVSGTGVGSSTKRGNLVHSSESIAVVRVWDITDNGTVSVNYLKGRHYSPSPPVALAISRNSMVMVVAYSSNIITVFLKNLKTGGWTQDQDLIDVSSGRADSTSITNVAISDNGDTIVSSALPGIKRWTKNNDGLWRAIRLDSSITITFLAVNNNGNVIFSSDSQPHRIIYRRKDVSGAWISDVLPSNDVSERLIPGSGAISAITTNANGTKLVVSGVGISSLLTIRMFTRMDNGTWFGEEVTKSNGFQIVFIRAIDLNPSEDAIVAISDLGAIKLWSLVSPGNWTMRDVRAQVDTTSMGKTEIKFRGSKNQFFSIDRTGIVNLWTIGDTWFSNTPLIDPQIFPPLSHSGTRQTLGYYIAYDSLEDSIVSSSRSDNFIKQWKNDTSTGNWSVSRVFKTLNTAHSSAIRPFRTSLNGDLIMTCTSNEIKTWSLDNITNSWTEELLLEDGVYLSVPSGGLITSASMSADANVIVSFLSIRISQTWRRNSYGKWVSNSPMNGGEPISTSSNGDLFNINENGTYAVIRNISGSTQDVLLWQSTGGAGWKLINSVRFVSTLLGSLQINPRFLMFAVGFQNGHIWLYQEIAPGVLNATILIGNTYIETLQSRAHTGRVDFLQFDVTGNVLYSSDNTGIIKIWKVHTGQLMSVHNSNTGNVAVPGYANRDLTQIAYITVRGALYVERNTSSSLTCDQYCMSTIPPPPPLCTVQYTRGSCYIDGIVGPGEECDSGKLDHSVTQISYANAEKQVHMAQANDKLDMIYLQVKKDGFLFVKVVYLNQGVTSNTVYVNISIDSVYASTSIYTHGNVIWYLSTNGFVEATIDPILGVKSTTYMNIEILSILCVNRRLDVIVTCNAETKCQTVRKFSNNTWSQPLEFHIGKNIEYDGDYGFCSLNTDGNLLIIYTAEGNTVHLFEYTGGYGWNLISNATISRIYTSHDGHIISFSIHPSKKSFIYSPNTEQEYGRIYIYEYNGFASWNVTLLSEEDEKIRCGNKAHGAPIYSLSFDNTGDAIVSMDFNVVTKNSVIKTWKLQTLQKMSEQVLNWNGNYFLSYTFVSTDFKRILVSGIEEDTKNVKTFLMTNTSRPACGQYCTLLNYTLIDQVQGKVLFIIYLHILYVYIYSDLPSLYGTLPITTTTLFFKPSPNYYKTYFMPIEVCDCHVYLCYSRLMSFILIT